MKYYMVILTNGKRNAALLNEEGKIRSFNNKKDAVDAGMLAIGKEWPMFEVVEL